MLVGIEQSESLIFTSPSVHFNCGLFLFVLRLLIMVVAVGLKMPVTWTLTQQQWVPQVYAEHFPTYRTVVSVLEHLWIPFFLFTSNVPFYITILMSIWNRYLMYAPPLPLMRAASKRLIILSEGNPFLPSDSHHSFPRLIDSLFFGLC